jgi:integrase/recombinase XerD
VKRLILVLAAIGTALFLIGGVALAATIEGTRGAADRHGPRLHDLRHRFATATLVNWYRSDQDAERRLPLLSAFLGHVHVSDTQWYLSGAPELMRAAMSRLERHWEQRP